MPTVRYVTVDVFTQTRFTGNPLAVILDAEELSSTDMQAIATEFNYSETTFVLPPKDPANSAQVRIFTPTMEVPFAGHPNVGTAYVLGQQADIFGKPVGDTLRFEEKAGLVEVSLTRENGKVAAASIRAPQALSTGSTVDTQSVADCLSLDVDNIRVTNHQPLYASVGLAFVFAELDSLDALGRAQPDLAAFKLAAKRYPGEGLDFPIFLYVRDATRPWHIRARMFSPLDNVAEDPATGSASAALAAYLVEISTDLPADGTTAITIEQGVEMGRRSVIKLEVTKREGKVSDVLVGGRCAMVMRGKLDC